MVCKEMADEGIVNGYTFYIIYANLVNFEVFLNQPVAILVTAFSKLITIVLSFTCKDKQIFS